MYRWLEEKGLKGQRILKSGPSCHLLSSGRMLLQPLEQQQKKPCPEPRPLLPRGVPEMSRTELQLMQSLGQLQFPQ